MSPETSIIISALVITSVSLWVLGSLWQKALIEAYPSRFPGDENQYLVSLRPFFKPGLLTILAIGGVIGLFFSVGPVASTENIQLHGFSELRAEQEAHAITQQELERLRQQWAQTARKAESENFEKEIDSGTKRMQKTRDKLLNRE